MGNFLKGLAKFLAVLSAIAFVITAVAALLLLNTEQRMFKAETYTAALEKQNIYQELPALVSRTIVSAGAFDPCAQNPLTCEDISPELNACYKQVLGADRMMVLQGGVEQPTEAEQQSILSCVEKFRSGTASTPGGMPPYMQILTTADWEFLVRSILPPQDLQTMAEDFLTQLFAYLNGETDRVSLSLAPLKKNLSSQPGLDALLQLIRSKPDCTLNDLIPIMNGSLPFCNPGEIVLQPIQPLLQEQLNMAANSIPEALIAIPPGQAGSNSPFARLQLARNIMRLSFMVPLVFLLLVTAFAIRSLRGWMQWWGIPLFFTGLITLIICLGTLPMVNLFWGNFIVPRFPAFLPNELVSAAHDIALAILRELGKWIMVEAGVITSLGLGAWIGSYFISNQE